MTTCGQDGATGAGTHPQAEAMGLGPATVVRLEGALGHEVLRYCTAMRRSALKVVRGKNGAGPLFDESERVDDRPQSKARGHEQQCESSTGRRKRPSTQASFKVRESKGQGQTGVVRFFPVSLPIPHASGGNVLCWTGAASLVRRHAVQDRIIWVSTIDS